MKFHDIHLRCLLFGALLCAFFTFASRASAGNIYYWHLYEHAIDDDWGNAGNWYIAGSNFGGNRYIIDNSGTATISSSVSCEAVSVSIPYGTLNVEGGSLSTSGYDTFDIGGLQGMGILNLNGGRVSVYSAYTSGDGMVSITSGTFAVFNSLIIGYSGTGSLNMSGGLVNASVASIGGYGDGYIPSYGTATITGGTFAVTSSLGIGGQGGGGNLNLNGGTVTAGFLVAIGTQGTGAANIANGALTTTSGLVIGISGTGEFNLSGGVVTANYANIGGFGGKGTATLTGGTLAVSGTIEIADTSGTGILNIGNGDTAGTLEAAEIHGGGGVATINFNHAGSIAFAPVLSGSLVVNKLASGTTTLTGANSYTGPTNITSGKLIVEASISASSLTTVSGGGALGGSGTIGALTIANGGVVAPGTGAGKLTVGNTTLQDGGTLQLDLTRGASGAAGIGYDQLAIAGDLDLTQVSVGGITLSLQSIAMDASAFDTGSNHIWNSIVAATGTINGFAANQFTIDLGGFFTGTVTGSFSVIQDGNTLSLQYLAVPEPNPWAILVGSGALLLVFRQKSRRMV